MRKSNVAFYKWHEFRSAINGMINSGVYKSLVDIHGAMERDPDGLNRTRHRMHGSMYGPVGYRRFLAWHRAFLIAFERELRNVNTELSILYWDWDNDAGRLVGVRNIIGLSSGRTLGRLPGEPNDGTGRPEWFSTPTQTQALEEFEGDYYVFSHFLEREPHNRGHGWVGGDMGNTRISPNDPIFWMHHAQIDRIWSEWQKRNPGEKPFLDANENKLDSWENKFDIDSINDISNIGNDSYEYEPLATAL
ncbi:tyrosinase family protein [Candidatus Spongiihabitans sp.]|uniref:tyrosinase family protein n=1 Tax=Candidatus Spongiihabitans sp. TaxID=3101308 RepID=UPI003C6F6BF7